MVVIVVVLLLFPRLQVLPEVPWLPMWPGAGAGRGSGVVVAVVLADGVVVVG